MKGTHPTSHSGSAAQLDRLRIVRLPGPLALRVVDVSCVWDMGVKIRSPIGGTWDSKELSTSTSGYTSLYTSDSFSDVCFLGVSSLVLDESPAACGTSNITGITEDDMA